VEWAQRCPAQDGGVIEIRPIFEFAELSADSKQVADA
jgi:hypothetical protein